MYGLTRDVGQFKNEDLDPKRNFDKEVLAMHSTGNPQNWYQNSSEILYGISR